MRSGPASWRLMKGSSRSRSRGTGADPQACRRSGTGPHHRPRGTTRRPRGRWSRGSHVGRGDRLGRRAARLGLRATPAPGLRPRRCSSAATAPSFAGSTARCAMASPSICAAWTSSRSATARWRQSWPMSKAEPTVSGGAPRLQLGLDVQCWPSRSRTLSADEPAAGTAPWHHTAGRELTPGPHPTVHWSKQ